MSLQHHKSQLNKVSRHLIGNSVPPNNILIPFSLSSAQRKTGYHYWLLMQGSLLIEERFKYSLDPTPWRNTLVQRLNSNLEFIGMSVEFIVLKDKNTDSEKVWERVWKKCRIVALCIPLDSWVFRNWILFYYQVTVCCQKKKHFSFTSSLIVPGTVSLLGPFTLKPKRLLIWMPLYHKDTLEDRFEDEVLPKLSSAI